MPKKGNMYMDTKDLVKKFIENNYMVEFKTDFKDSDSFLDSGIIDSTGVLELIVFLEEKFGIKVEDAEIIPANLDSFKNIDSYIKLKTTKN